MGRGGIWEKAPKRRGRKGSMTVEAALVMSLVLLILMGCMKETITLYQRVAERAGVCWVELADIDREFRLRSLGKRLFK